MSSAASSASADAPLPPPSVSAAASIVQSSLRPRSPTLTRASDHGSATDSRRVRARLEGEQPNSAAALGFASSSSTSPPSCAAVLPMLAPCSKHQLREIVEALQGRLMTDLAAQPPASSPIALLAKIELQLIMQCCDRVSLLSLARCSRTTLAAASSDFAWRCLSPMRICSSVPNLGQKLSASLLRHVDVCLWWTESRPSSPFPSPAEREPRISDDPVAAAEPASISSVSRMRGFRCYRSIHSKQLEQLLSHPAFAQLTELSVHRIWSQFLGSLPRYQPLLRILSVNALTNFVPWEALPDDLSPLAQLQHLTELRLTCCELAKPVFSALNGCRSLRTLSLSGFADMWPPLFSALTPHSLRSLHLDLWSIQKPRDPQAWEAVFANQRTLESLQLSRCNRVDELLWLVTQHCRSLYSLTVHSSHVVDSAAVDQYSNELPSLAVLRACLSQLPSMCLKLELHSRGADVDTFSRHPLAERWDAAYAGFMQLAAEFEGRVKLITFDFD